MAALHLVAKEVVRCSKLTGEMLNGVRQISSKGSEETALLGQIVEKAEIEHQLNNSINDYLHKITKYLACYCEERNIGTLIIGDLTNIRKERDLGRRTNQKLHGLPYREIYRKLEYKLKKKGIRMVLQEESYSSQCSPKAKEVSRKYAEKKNRVKRGLYKDQGILYHADAVGAYNIMRKYLALSGKEKELPVSGLKEIKRIKVAV